MKLVRCIYTRHHSKRGIPAGVMSGSIYQICERTKNNRFRVIIGNEKVLYYTWRFIDYNKLKI